MSGQPPIRAQEKMAEFAAALLNAAEVLDAIKVAHPEFDALCDEPTFLGDLGSLGHRVDMIADAWLDEIEAAQAAANEAEDRRRDNPLEPDFRRLGQ